MLHYTSCSKALSLLFLIAMFLGCTSIPDNLRDEAEGKLKSSSSANGTIFEYCVYFGQKTCEKGYFTSCEGSGILSNTCPYSSGSSSSGVGSSSSSSVQEGCGGTIYNSETHFCHTDNKVYYKCGNTYDPATHYCKGGNTITKYGSVIIDGNTYKTIDVMTVLSGTKTWMAENVNSGACYDDYDSNCDKYGGLYNWAEAMDICPAGWSLPSDADWEDLIFVTGRLTAGKDLKATSYWNGCATYGSDNLCINKYGFAALPGGYGNSRGDFYNVGYEGYYWSATEDEEDDEYFAYYYNMGYGRESIVKESNSKLYLFSVRCVKL